MARDPERLRQRLEVLRQIFIAQLPERLGAISAQYRAVLDAGFDDETLHALCLAAHSLKGSAATYGYTPTSAAAGRLEAAINALMARDRDDRRSAADSLHPLLETLAGSAGTAEGPLPDLLPAADEDMIALKESARTEKSVYMLEDDIPLRDLLSVQLGHYGYHVHAFAEAEAFRAAVIRQAPDAMIIDIMMAESDTAGLDILADLRKQAMRLPAIVATVRADLNARVSAVRAGADAYFTKPVDLTELVATLDRLTLVEPPTPYRILIVDDDPVSAEYQGEVLRFAGMETRIVNVPEAAIEQLSDFHPDLLLLDMYMPRISGADLAAVIRQQWNFASLPIVFLSSENDPDKQLAMTIGGGADDFLTKPIHPDRLISSITARAERSRLLLSLTIQDPMTKLLNHTATKDRLRAELTRARRADAPVVFALLDIDHFKQVNDTYGHPVGDSVIWGLARLLRQRLRQSDAVGRYGGEEFGVIMPDTTLDEAVDVLDTLRRAFGEIEFLAGKTMFTMAFSCGVVMAQRTHQPAEIIRLADEALYEAKRNGRNQIRVR